MRQIFFIMALLAGFGLSGCDFSNTNEDTFYLEYEINKVSSVMTVNIFTEDGTVRSYSALYADAARHLEKAQAVDGFLILETTMREKFYFNLVEAREVNIKDNVVTVIY